MKRDIEKELIAWKNSNHKMPLLIRGARQVGKSYSVEKFGKENFQNCITINFEFNPEFSKSFQTLNPKEIINNLEIQTNSHITPGKTLLFLDEIQECQQAIQSLRYFKEQMPELHVIGAGSLLEFVLNDEKFVFPVGRIQFMYLRPLSFTEFLLALGQTKLLEILKNASLNNIPNEIAHEQLMKLVRQYLFVGGMPAVVKAFVNSPSEYQQIQLSLLNTYRTYFGKYTTKAQHKYLSLLFEKAPTLVGKHFKYTSVDSEIRSRELKIALEQLCWAALTHKINVTSASGTPLKAQIKEKKFKIIFLDTGLFQCANQIDPKNIFEQKNIIQINAGALAEQFVGQELLAYNNFYGEKQLYFWEREKSGSSAEIDYLITIKSQNIPIEVKAGKTGRLKSLQIFMKEKKCSLGVRISQNSLSLENNILNIPFYLISQLPRLSCISHNLG